MSINRYVNKEVVVYSYKGNITQLLKGMNLSHCI